MKRRTMNTGELILLVGTRALLGAGIGLLVSKRLSEEQCKAIGLTLVLVGALTTVPLAMDLLASNADVAEGEKSSAS